MAAAALTTNVETSDARAIAAVVAAQLAAFARNDGPAAFALTSPGIRARFPDARAFLTMVRDHYEIVHRPRFVRYGAVLRIGTRRAQELLLVGHHGEVVRAIYYVLKMPDGTFRTDGCRLVAVPSARA